MEWDKKTMWRMCFAEYGFSAEIVMHSEREDSSYGLPPRIWNTYLVFVDTYHIMKGEVTRDPLVDWLWGKTKDYEGPLSALSWNCGVTYYEEETRANGQRKITVGDDYCHAWDDGKHDLYGLAFMQHAVSALAKEMHALALGHSVSPTQQPKELA